MRTLRYDGTWEGLLCALYHGYEQLRLRPERARPRIRRRGAAGGGLFEEVVEVATEQRLAERVRAGIRRHGSARMLRRLHRAWLSEEPGVEHVLLDYLDALGDHGADVEHDVLLAPVREVERLARRVGREVHRMHAFVRFEACRPDGGDEGRRLWRAVVEPACDVLPLLGDHFTARFPAQRWIIVDARRGRMLYWDTETLHLLEAAEAPEGAAREAPEEAAYQQLWRAYFAAVDIPERRNLRLQARHLPQRYRRHLTELSTRVKRTLRGPHDT